MKSIIEEHRRRLIALLHADLQPRIDALNLQIDGEADYHVRQEIALDRQQHIEWGETVEQALEYLAGLEIRNHDQVVRILSAAGGRES